MLYLIVGLASSLFFTIALASACVAVVGFVAQRRRLMNVSLIICPLAVALAVVTFGWAYDLAF